MRNVVNALKKRKKNTFAYLSSFYQMILHFVNASGRPIHSHFPLHVLRGVFMRFISEVDPELGSKIHEPGGIPPYTAQVYIRDHEIDLVFNLFSKELNQAFSKYLVKNTKPQYHLGQVECILHSVDLKRHQLGDLVDNARVVSNFKIIFMKPAYFKNKDGSVVLHPEPAILFQNLARIWNDITGDLAPVDTGPFCDWVGKHVRITSYKLKTDHILLGKDGRRGVTGFVGWTKFNVNRDACSSKYCSIIDMLLKFATFCNVGGNRTTGLGNIKYYPFYTK